MAEEVKTGRVLVAKCLCKTCGVMRGPFPFNGEPWRCNECNMPIFGGRVTRDKGSLCHRCGSKIVSTKFAEGECPCSFWQFYGEGGWYHMGLKKSRKELVHVDRKKS